MAWYNVNCPECGVEYRVQLYGKTRDREWKFSSWDWTCESCKEKARAEAAREAAEENREQGLPSLTGSEKQIAWAEQIRAAKLEQADKWLSEKVEKHARVLARQFRFPSEDVFVTEIRQATSDMAGQDSAKWWIDRRFELGENILLDAAKSRVKAAESLEHTPEAKAVEAESTIRPETAKTETVAKIEIIEDHVVVRFPEKRQDFWEVIKPQLRFTWFAERSAWTHRPSSVNTAHAKAVETAAVLLANGFVVCVPDEAIRADVVAGKAVRENTRKVEVIQGGDHKGWFAISWEQCKSWRFTFGAS